MAKQLLSDPVEKLKLSQLLLRAGKRAKDNSAYQPAANFLLFAVDCLPSDAWKSHYSFTLELYKHLAESQYLRGNYNDAEALYPQIIIQAKTNLEKISVYWIKMNQLEFQQRCILIILIIYF